MVKILNVSLVIQVQEVLVSPCPEYQHVNFLGDTELVICSEILYFIIIRYIFKLNCKSKHILMIISSIVTTFLVCVHFAALHIEFHLFVTRHRQCLHMVTFSK